LGHPLSRKLIIPGAAFTGPRLSNDPILTDGSLLLVDVTHPAKSWPTTRLTNGLLVPNLAEKFAKEAIDPAAAAGAFDAPMWLPGRATAQGRSSKGAFIYGAAGASPDIHLRFPEKVLAYLITNKAHTFFTSWWGGQSYTNGAGIGGFRYRAAADSVQGNDQVFFGHTATGGYNVAAGQMFTTNSSVSVPGQARMGLASTGHPGTINQTAAQAMSQSRIFGQQGPAGTPGALPLEMLFQRFYLEDLTVSGRTYAQAEAADAERFAELVTDPAGRYGSETTWGTQATTTA
jgi:hypothetical protein